MCSTFSWLERKIKFWIYQTSLDGTRVIIVTLHKHVLFSSSCGFSVLPHHPVVLNKDGENELNDGLVVDDVGSCCFSLMEFCVKFSLWNEKSCQKPTFRFLVFKIFMELRKEREGSTSITLRVTLHISHIVFPALITLQILLLHAGNFSPHMTRKEKKQEGKGNMATAETKPTQPVHFAKTSFTILLLWVR